MHNSQNPDNYNSGNDFLNDVSFINFHFRLDDSDEIFWNDWITSHPEKIDVINEARGILNMLSFTLPDNEYDTELEKIKLAIDRRINEKQAKIIPMKRSSAGRISWKLVAAVFVVLFTTGYFLLYYFISSKSAVKEQTNNTANIIKITLGDNSIVSLSPGSSITYDEPFKKNERVVHLKGNAGFEVTKHSEAPFKVYSGNVVSVVLGTVFNIKSTGEDSLVTIDLIRGKLKVAMFNDKGTIVREMILLPNQRAVYTNYQQSLVKQSFQPEPDKRNTRSDISFQKSDFSEVAGMIRKTYGLVLINESNNNDWKFSGAFKNSTAKEIIESICLIKGLNNSIKGDTIFIR